MSSGIGVLTESQIGRIAYRPIQKILHFVRRRMHPELPIAHKWVRAEYRGRRLAIEVRRWVASDSEAVDQCFRESQYEIPAGVHSAYIEGLYSKIVASGRKPLIVDCGANIGASVLWFRARYPQAHIIAVEPAPDNFALLSRNCSLPDIDLWPAGIGAQDGTAWLSNPKASKMAYRTNSAGDGVEIRIVSLETLLKDKSIAECVPFLLKVDIEGAERSLFTGDATLLDRFPLIVMEPHDWLLPGERTSVEFFRFHANAGREFIMKHENVVSIAYGRD